MGRQAMGGGPRKTWPEPFQSLPVPPFSTFRGYILSPGKGRREGRVGPRPRWALRREGLGQRGRPALRSRRRSTGPPVLPAPSGHKSGPWVRLNDSMSHPESQTPAGSLCVCTQPLPGGLASHVQTSLLRRSSPECPRDVRQLKSPPV